MLTFLCFSTNCVRLARRRLNDIVTESCDCSVCEQFLCVELISWVKGPKVWFPTDKKIQIFTFVLAGSQGNATFSRPIEAAPVLSETLTFFKSERYSVGDAQVWLIFNLLESQRSVVKIKCLCVRICVYRRLLCSTLCMSDRPESCFRSRHSHRRWTRDTSGPGGHSTSRGIWPGTDRCGEAPCTELRGEGLISM